MADDSIVYTLELADKFSAILDRANSAFDKLYKSVKDNEAAFSELGGDAEKAANSVGNAGNKAEEAEQKHKKLSESLKQVGKDMEDMGQKITLATAPLIALGAAAIKFASDWQTTLNQVHNNTTMTSDDIAQMDQSVRAMASGTSASMESMARGIEHAANLNYTLAESQNITNEAMKSAVSTGGDVEKTTNVLASTMKEFGMSGDQAAQAMDLLHNAAAQGNMRLEEFVDGGRRAISTAANLGDSLADVTAVYATLTQHGFDAATAGTQLTGMLTHIVNPAKAAKAELEALSEKTGIDLVGDFSQAGIQAKGLAGVMQDVQKAVGGNTEEVLKLIPALRGGQGALALVNMGSEDLIRVLGSQNDVIAGKLKPTEDSWLRTQQTLGFQIGEFRNQLHLAAITLGEDLLPKIVPVAQQFMSVLPDAIHGVVAAFTALPGPVQGGTLAFVGLLAAAGPILMIGGQLLTVIGSLANPIGLATLGIVGLAAVLITLYTNSESARNAMDHVGSGLRTWGESIVWAGGGVKDFIVWIGGLISKIGEMGNAFDEAQRGSFGTFFKVLADTVSLAKDQLDKLTSSENNNADAAKLESKAQQDLNDALTGLDKQGKTAGDKIEFLRSAYEKLANQINQTDIHSEPQKYQELSSELDATRDAASKLGATFAFDVTDSLGKTHVVLSNVNTDVKNTSDTANNFKHVLDGTSGSVQSFSTIVEDADPPASEFGDVLDKIAKNADKGKSAIQGATQYLKELTGILVENQPQLELQAQAIKTVGSNAQAAFSATTVGDVYKFADAAKDAADKMGLTGPQMDRISKDLQAIHDHGGNAKGAIDDLKKALEDAQKPLTDQNAAWEDNKKLSADEAQSSIPNLAQSIGSLQKTMQEFVDAFLLKMGIIPDSMKEIVTRVADNIYSVDFSKPGADKAKEFIEGVLGGKAIATNAGSDIAHGVVDGMDGGKGGAQNAGYALGDALSAAVRAKIDEARAAGFALGDATVNGMRGALTVSSPSKKGIEAGEMLVAGLVGGISDKTPDAAEAAKAMGLATDAAFTDYMGIHSWSTRFRAYGSNIVEAAIVGTDETLPQLAEAASRVAETITKPMDQAAVQVSSSFASVSEPALKLQRDVAGIDTEIARLNVELSHTEPYTAQNQAIQDQIKFLEGWKNQITSVINLQKAEAAQVEANATAIDKFNQRMAQITGQATLTKQVGATGASLLTNIFQSAFDPSAGTKAADDLDKILSDPAFQKLPHAKEIGNKLRDDVMAALADPTNADKWLAVMFDESKIKEVSEAAGKLSSGTFMEAYRTESAHADINKLLGPLGSGFNALTDAVKQGGAGAANALAKFVLDANTVLNTLPDNVKNVLGPEFMAAVQQVADSGGKEGLDRLQAASDQLVEASKVFPTNFAKLNQAAQDYVSQQYQLAAQGAQAWGTSEDNVKKYLSERPSNYNDLDADTQAFIDNQLRLASSGAETWKDAERKIKTALSARPQDYDELDAATQNYIADQAHLAQIGAQSWKESQANIAAADKLSADSFKNATDFQKQEWNRLIGDAHSGQIQMTDVQDIVGSGWGKIPKGLEMYAPSIKTDLDNLLHLYETHAISLMQLFDMTDSVLQAYDARAKQLAADAAAQAAAVKQQIDDARKYFEQYGFGSAYPGAGATPPGQAGSGAPIGQATNAGAQGMSFHRMAIPMIPGFNTKPGEPGYAETQAGVDIYVPDWYVAVINLIMKFLQPGNFLPGAPGGIGFAGPHFARGTRGALGGLALVGEEGPELVNLPFGAAVFPTSVTEAVLPLLRRLGVPGYAGGTAGFFDTSFQGDGPAEGIPAAGGGLAATLAVMGPAQDWVLQYLHSEYAGVGLNFGAEGPTPVQADALVAMGATQAWLGGEFQDEVGSALVTAFSGTNLAQIPFSLLGDTNFLNKIRMAGWPAFARGTSGASDRFAITGEAGAELIDWDTRSVFPSSLTNKILSSLSGFGIKGYQGGNLSNGLVEWNEEPAMFRQMLSALVQAEYTSLISDPYLTDPEAKTRIAQIMAAVADPSTQIHGYIDENGGLSYFEWYGQSFPISADSSATGVQVVKDWWYGHSGPMGVLGILANKGSNSGSGLGSGIGSIVPAGGLNARETPAYTYPAGSLSAGRSVSESGGVTVVFNNYAPVYGVQDFQGLVRQAVEQSGRRGSFYGTIPIPGTHNG